MESHTARAAGHARPRPRRAAPRRLVASGCPCCKPRGEASPAMDAPRSAALDGHLSERRLRQDRLVCTHHAANPGPNPEIIWSAHSLHARPHAPLHTPPHTHPRPHLFRPASSHAPHSQDVHSDREHFRRGLPRERATQHTHVPQRHRLRWVG
eukprot:scaffold66831_cov69-Phaeocystis_antarctica.AAC.4